jgi:hypothetical protein
MTEHKCKDENKHLKVVQDENGDWYWHIDLYTKEKLWVTYCPWCGIKLK